MFNVCVCVCVYVHIFVELCIYMRTHGGVLFSNLYLTPAARLRCQDSLYGFVMYKWQW